MSNATAVSDLERAEHNGTFGVKKVAVYNDDGAGNLSLQPKTATEETLQAVADPLVKYKSAGMDIAANPYYFGYLKTDGEWYIKKLDTTLGTTYVKGSSGYATAWTGRVAQSYDLYDVIFG